MTIVVPVIMLLGILWALYDRECALALTVLGASLFVLWGVRRYGSSMYVGTTVKVCVVIYLVLLAALAALTKSGKLNKLLPPKRISCRYMQPAVFPRWLCWPLCWAVASPTTPCGHWQRWSSHWLSTTRSSSYKCEQTAPVQYGPELFLLQQVPICTLLPRKYRGHLTPLDTISKWNCMKSPGRNNCFLPGPLSHKIIARKESRYPINP